MQETQVTLFTFNSKKSTIVLSLVCFIIIVILYNLIIPKLYPDGALGFDHRSRNFGKIDKFLQQQDIEVVILGSSKAATLKQEYLPDTYLNMAFSGGSSVPGLAVIEKSNKNPKYIFVEINSTLERGESEEMTNYVGEPILSDIRNILPIARYSYQPITILKETLANPITSKAIGENYKDFSKKEIRYKSSFQRNLNEKLDVNNGEKRRFHESFELMEELVDRLEQNGSTVIFFNTPVPIETYNSPEETLVRTKAYSTFNRDDYLWLEVDREEYSTIDGVHLYEDSAYRYLQEMISFVNNLEE